MFHFLTWLRRRSTPRRKPPILRNQPRNAVRGVEQLEHKITPAGSGIEIPA